MLSKAPLLQRGKQFKDFASALRIANRRFMPRLIRRKKVNIGELIANGNYNTEVLQILQNKSLTTPQKALMILAAQKKLKIALRQARRK